MFTSTFLLLFIQGGKTIARAHANVASFVKHCHLACYANIINKSLEQDTGLVSVTLQGRQWKSQGVWY